MRWASLPSGISEPAAAGALQLKPEERAVSSPSFRGFLSIFASGTGLQFSVWLSFTVTLVNLPPRRGRDTAADQKTDIQLYGSGLECGLKLLNES